MNLTHHQAKYFAHELTLRHPPDSLERLAGAVAGAQVDLNPHQVDAALFAFNSPFSKGALLADEVGLGKTIEAGLVLSQKWAERKRRILVITPANLRKQWHQELTEKFFLPCRILEAKPYNAAIRQGQFRPFDGDDIVICSYQFARSKANDVANTPWDLVVIDEALCKLEGFTCAPSDAVYWQQGYSIECDFIYMTTASLSHEQLQQLSDEVGPERSLLVLCTAFRGRGDYPNLTVKKIPRQVLSRCEWGHDDYSLRVENLPKAPPVVESPLSPTLSREGRGSKAEAAGQQGLFGDEPA